MKKKKLSSLKRKADKLWSERVREVGVCCFCGSTAHLNSHHCVSRRYTPLRWDLRNGICLCCKCHKFDISGSSHNNPWVVMDWLRDHRPDDINYLREMSKQPIKKTSVEDIEKIIKALRGFVSRKPTSLAVG